MTNEEFDKFKLEFEARYKLIGEIRCPYFQEPVIFNAKGLEHLKFMRKHHARTIEEQTVRIKLFPLAQEIINTTRTIQGISHTHHFEVERTNQRSETKLLPVSYYEFVAILNEKRVRVVVKQISNGPKFFWSVIPFWKIDKNNNRRKMNYGNPELD